MLKESEMVRILAEKKEKSSHHPIGSSRGILIPNKPGLCPYPICRRKEERKIENCIKSKACKDLLDKPSFYSVLFEINGQKGFFYIIGKKYLDEFVKTTRYLIDTFEFGETEVEKELEGGEEDIELKALLLNYYLNNYKTVTFKAPASLLTNLNSKARNLRAEGRLINSDKLRISFTDLDNIEREFCSLIEKIKLEFNALRDQIKNLKEGNLENLDHKIILEFEEDIDAISWGIYKTALWNNILVRTSSIYEAKENIILAASAKIAERIGDKIGMITHKFLVEVAEYLENNPKDVEMGEFNDLIDKSIEILNDELKFIDKILFFVKEAEAVDGKEIKVLYDEAEKKLKELNSILDNVNLPNYLVRRAERLLIWTWRILANLYTMYFWTVSMREPA